MTPFPVKGMLLLACCFFFSKLCSTQRVPKSSGCPEIGDKCLVSSETAGKSKHIVGKPEIVRLINFKRMSLFSVYLSWFHMEFATKELSFKSHSHKQIIHNAYCFIEMQNEYLIWVAVMHYTVDVFVFLIPQCHRILHTDWPEAIDWISLVLTVMLAAAQITGYINVLVLLHYCYYSDKLPMDLYSEHCI